MGGSITSRFIIGTLLCIAIAAFATPLFVHAAYNQADLKCQPVQTVCGCGQIMGQNGCTGGANMFMCQCSDVTNGGNTTGYCDAPMHCHGVSTSGAAGQAGGQLGMQQLLSALQGLMSALKGGGGSGGGGGSVPTSGTGGCSTFYQTSIQGNPDPCSYYVPNASVPIDNLTVPSSTSSQDSVCTSYSQTSNPNDPNPCVFYVPPGTTNQTNTSGSSTATTTTVNVTVNVPGQSFFSTLLNSIVGLTGAGGNIDVSGNGATIYAGNSDQKTNTSVAGFYGSNSQQPLGIVARLCISRPWAGSFLSFLIPPSFFDSLCSLRGYQVGPTPPPSSVIQQQAPAPSQPAPAPLPLATTTPTDYVPPQADIWAVPGSVPIGARTSIFWNSRGVNSCIVTSPDGSFSETALSGGASTVPIVATTVFTISCVAPDGSHVTNTVTVSLKI